MRSVLAITVLLAACAGDDAPAPQPTTPTSTGDTSADTATSTVDTGYELNDMGQVFITHHQDNNRSFVMGFFAEAITGAPNLAECAVKDVPCLTRLPPDVETCEEYDARAEFTPDAFITRFLGLQVDLGPYTLNYYNAPSLDYSYYFADITPQVRQNGWYTGDVGLSWDDEDSMWQPPHEAKPDLFIPQPIELQRPEQGSVMFFPNGTRLPVEWVPTGIGEVYVRIAQEFGVAWICRVEDDGYFEVDVDTLGFGSDPEEMRISVERWTRSTVRRKGNLLDMASVTDVSFTGNYFNIGNRDPIEPANKCAEAQGQPPMEAGEYWGRIASPRFENSVITDPYLGFNPCTGQPSDGIDAFVKVEIGPLEALSAVLNMRDQSASLYALETCSSPNSCVVGSDKSEKNDFSEFVSIFNPTEDPQTRYLVIDTTFFPDLEPGPDLDSGIFTLDISKQTLVDPLLVDACNEANSNPPLTTGTYYSENLAFTNSLNPGSSGCTGTSLPGPEGMIAVELAAGQTIDVGLQATGADVAVYLLRDCTDPFSNPTEEACSDTDADQNQVENITYTNDTGANERLTLVVDSKTGLAPYFLAVNIF